MKRKLPRLLRRCLADMDTLYLRLPQGGLFAYARIKLQTMHLRRMHGFFYEIK